jgi:hypothetical protein
MAPTDTAIRTTKPCAKPLELSKRGRVVVRVVNYPRFLAVIGLCSGAYLVGLPVNTGSLSFISYAMGQPTTLTKSQSDALNAYSKTGRDFRLILSERRARINSNQWTSTLSCSHQNDGRVQRPHRPAAV